MMFTTDATRNREICMWGRGVSLVGAQKIALGCEHGCASCEKARVQPRPRTQPTVGRNRQRPSE
jgi:hypothetical protein